MIGGCYRIITFSLPKIDTKKINGIKRKALGHTPDFYREIHHINTPTSEVQDAPSTWGRLFSTDYINF